MKPLSTVNYSDPSLENHMRFICPECGLGHPSQLTWRRHLNEDHDYIHKTAQDLQFKEVDSHYHECLVCHKWVANAHQAIAVLQYHRFQHLPFNHTFECRHCQGFFSRKRQLIDHLYRVHGELLKQYDKVEKKEGDKSVESADPKNPKTNSEFYMRFICPQCGKLFTYFQQWLQHINNSHVGTSTDLRMHRINGNKNFYCLQCKKLFYTSDRSKLQRHRFTHLPHKYYFKCAFCTIKKCYKSEMLRHFIYMHPEKYIAAEIYIRKPLEWGGSVSSRLNDELDDLLANPDRQINVKNKNLQQADLIQMALFESCIDLDREPAEDKMQINEHSVTGASNNESKRIASCFKSANSSQDTNELDALCAEIFEEIANEPTALPIQSNGGCEPSKTSQTKNKLPTEFSEKVIKIEINTVDRSEQQIRTPLPRIKGLQLNVSTLNKNLEDNFNYEKFILYLCPECGLEFKKKTVWRAHVYKDHNLTDAICTNFKRLENKKNSYLCRICLRLVETAKSTEMQRHYFMHMPFQAYLKCHFCCGTKSSKPKMLEHMQKEHKQCFNHKTGKSIFHCKDCGKCFHTQGRWRSHRNLCMQRTNLPVRLYNISDNLRLIAHLKSAHLRIQKLSAKAKSA